METSTLLTGIKLFLVGGESGGEIFTLLAVGKHQKNSMSSICISGAFQNCSYLCHSLKEFIVIKLVALFDSNSYKRV